jgi:hypothetical protein
MRTTSSLSDSETAAPHPADRPTNPSRSRFLKRSLAAAGLAAVGLKTVGEQTARAATTFGDALVGNGPFGLRMRNNSTANDAAAIRGEMMATTAAIGSAGLRGKNAGTNNNGMGVYGSHAGGGSGVRGTSKSGAGISGMSTTGSGGDFTSTHGPGINVQSENQIAAIINSTNDNGMDVIGENIGITASSRSSGNFAYLASALDGVMSHCTAENGYAIYATTLGDASGALYARERTMELRGCSLAASLSRRRCPPRPSSSRSTTRSIRPASTWSMRRSSQTSFSISMPEM